MSGSRWTETRDVLMGISEEALRHDADGIEVHFLNDVAKGRTVKVWPGIRSLVNGGVPQGVLWRNNFGANWRTWLVVTLLLTILWSLMQNEEEMKQLFDSVRPDRGTPTGQRLDQILTAYITRLEDTKKDQKSEKLKPLNLIVITDGAPYDDPEVPIVAAARRLDEGQFPLAQVGVQFIQIGNDRGARKALGKLDEDIGKKHGVRDIVDTRPYTGSQLTLDLLIAMLLGGINKRVDKIEEVEGAKRK
ncbi:hypothetical protein FRC09_004316 [Ceratobasidium sp. 395]|nr:hypothetical protein FRC09_004316 [Ceratobasidium sp. 395]